MSYFIVAFVFGLFIGSFLNSLAFRLEAIWQAVKLPRGASPYSNRSFCPDCGHLLSFFDLIPIASFLFLRGKCRYCHGNISLRYLLVELTVGLLFGLIFYSLGNTLYSYYLILISFFLIVIFLYDLRHFIIPDSVLIPAILIALGYLFIFDYINLSQYIFSGLGVALFFLLIFVFSKGRWIGFGDVKLGLLVGLMTGFPNVLVALFCAFLLGSLVGILLILFGKKKIKSEVPFGPFLIFGIYIAILFGNSFVDWYLNLIL